MGLIERPDPIRGFVVGEQVQALVPTLKHDHGRLVSYLVSFIDPGAGYRVDYAGFLYVPRVSQTLERASKDKPSVWSYISADYGRLA